jgi:hypothetical protein
MLSLICAASLVIVGQPGPAEVHAAALGDLVQRVPPEKHRDTRYVSLHEKAPGKDRDNEYLALLFTLNSTSFRATLAQSPRVYSGSLVRLSLSSLGWDVTSRAARIERLRGQGVDVSTFKPDLWEEIVYGEPYFLASQQYQGQYIRGWVDPEADRQLRNKVHSSKAIVRADWLISRLLQEQENRGVYSQALLFPDKEADLYKAFGIDEKFLEGPSLRNGGAVSDSGVALHARELQIIPSLYGADEKYIWRTFDFATDEVGDKSPFDRLGGTVKFDGREIIGSLPNGLLWYRLSDGKGNRVAVVPQNIAIDQRTGAFRRIKDRSVITAHKCIDCHSDTGGGLQPFVDEVSKAMLNPRIGLAVISSSKGRVEQLAETLEDYYISDLAGKISRQNAAYSARVKATNGLTSSVNGQAINDAIESYLYDLITPEQASREMGVSLAAATVQWRSSGNSYLVLLSGGQPIRRAAWEAAFGDAQRATVYPWEGKP